jgi:uncharacterized protein involved in exopolysaccharide biosynthesis
MQFVETVEAESASPSRTVAKIREQDWLADAVRLLWDERQIIWRVTRNGVLLATLVVVLLPNRYTSTTRLMPPEQQSSTTAALMATVTGRVGLPGGLPDLLGAKTSGDLFIAILRSETVENALINRFDLRRVYFRKYYESARKDLERATEIHEDTKSGVITIAVEDRNRQRAADVTHAYVEELDRAVVQLSTSAARRERIFLESRLKKARQELADSQRQFSEFASKNATLDVKEQTKAMVGAAAELQGQIIGSKSEMQALEQMYTPNNVRVRAVQQKTAELERQLRKLGGVAETGGAEDAGKQSVTDIYPDIRQLPLLGVQWADLYREVKVQETVYELLTQQHELAQIQEAKEIPTVKVLDPGELPERKSSPHRLLMILGACFFCVTLASMWILGQDRWRSVDPQDPWKQVVEEIAGAVGFRWRRLRQRFCKRQS